MKKRNWVSVLLSGILAVSLTACGGGAKESNAPKDNNQKTETAAKSDSKYPEKPCLQPMVVKSQ